MFAQDKSAEQPIGPFLPLIDTRWRDGVRRFRRGGRRLARGVTLFGRGVGDLVAGFPAVVVVGAILLLIWITRNVALLRGVLNWIVRNHAAMVELFVKGLRLLSGALRVLAFALAVSAVMVAVVPTLSPIIDWLRSLPELRLPSDFPAPRMPDLPSIPEIPPLPDRIPIDWSELWGATRQVAGRVFYVLALLIAVVVTATIAAVVIAYLAFAAFLVLRAVGLALYALLNGVGWLIVQVVRGALSLLRAIWSAAAWTVRGAAWILVGLGRGIARGGKAIVGGVRWLAVAVLRGLWFLISGAAKLVVFVLLGAVRLAWGAVWAVARGVVGIVVAVFQGGAAVGRWLWRSALAACRVVFLGLAAVAGFVWANVFRLFALSGIVAFVSVTTWAIDSMWRGRPIPDSLADLATSTVYAAAALLAAFSLFAILAAIAFAVRRMPPKVVRTAGLVALILLALAPTPFLLQAAWDSEAGTAIRGAGPEVLTAINRWAPMIVGAAFAVGLLWLAVYGLWALARRMTVETWRALRNGATAAVLAVVAMIAVAALWRALPRSEIAAATSEMLEALGQALTAVALPAAVIAAAVLALLAIAKMPASMRRAAGIVGGVVVAVALFVFVAAPLVRPIDFPEAYAEATDRWEAWWRQWRPDPEQPTQSDEGPDTESPAPTEPSEPEPPRDDAPAPERAQQPDVQLAVARDAQRLFPEGDAALHWRFGSAALIGDGLTAFTSLEEPGRTMDPCSAGAIVAVGMASSEGPEQINATLSVCRAVALAAVAQARLEACADPDAIEIFLLDLGESALGVDTPDDRRPLILATRQGTMPSEEAADALDPVVASHSGDWTLSRFSSVEAYPQCVDR